MSQPKPQNTSDNADYPSQTPPEMPVSDPALAEPLPQGLAAGSEKDMSPDTLPVTYATGLPELPQKSALQRSRPRRRATTEIGLAPINVVEFLPSLSRWVTFGSCFCVGVTALGAISTNFITYRTTIRTTAVVRPGGEAKLVQVGVTGPVTGISVNANTRVEKGQVLARLDDSRLQTQASQLEGGLAQGARQLAQIKAQLGALDQQVNAEVLRVKGVLDSSQAALAQSTRDYQDRQVSSQTEVDEAAAQLNLARQEVASFRQLVDSGAVSQLQLAERESSLATAEARLRRLQTGLNPSSAEVTAAEAKIVEERSRGIALLAQLRQSREQVVQQSLELQQSMGRDRQELVQIQTDIKAATIKASATGNLYELRLRNLGQVVTAGETIAQIIPDESPLEIKAVVPANQINKVKVGQPTQMRISACPFSQFGTLAGTVTTISPDIIASAAASGAGEAAAGGLSAPGSQGAGYIATIKPNEQALRSGPYTCPLKPGNEGRLTIISRKETVRDFLWRKIRLQADF